MFRSRYFITDEETPLWPILHHLKSHDQQHACKAEPFAPADSNKQRDCVTANQTAATL